MIFNVCNDFCNERSNEALQWTKIMYQYILLQCTCVHNNVHYTHYNTGCYNLQDIRAAQRGGDEELYGDLRALRLRLARVHLQHAHAHGVDDLGEPHGDEKHDQLEVGRRRHLLT